jgi:hypothetical protein
MSGDSINELTFAGWLAEFTATRAKHREDTGEPVLIASAAIEERQVDSDGRVRRCDIRFNSASGRKLASGELKRPEVSEGRDPRNEKLRFDARRKAIARGLPYYFTCNIASVILYAVANTPQEDDVEVGAFELAPVTRSGSFLRSAYHLKRALGESHASALSTIWGCVRSSHSGHGTVMAWRREAGRRQDNTKIKGVHKPVFGRTARNGRLRPS